MKLLVTGGAGFIGSNFVLYWLGRHPGDQVTNLDLLTYAGNLENLKPAEGNKSHEFVKGDILDSGLVDGLVGRTDVIVHFAAESHVDRSILEPAAFLKTNILGTQVLLDAAVKHKKRFHHISTDEVFGSLDLDEVARFDEKTPYDPHSPYSASKASSDHLVRAYADTYGLEATISNCSNNYGPYQFPEKLFPLFITNLIEGRKVPVYGDGKNIRDWLYVEDHCEAIDLILNKGKIGETYCIGGEAERDNLTITRTILGKMGKGEEMIEYVKDRPGHDLRYAIDISKIKNELDWEPKVSFDQGVDRTIAWYRDNQDWWKNIKSGQYKDYYKKQYENR